MTYHNRTRRTTNNNFKYWPYLIDEKYHHQMPYFFVSKRRKADPVSGKFLGYKLDTGKQRCVQKQVRQGSQKLCKQGIKDYLNQE